jgi:DNA-binding transcriptional MerR regulator
MAREERYRMREVQRMLGVSRTVITQLVAGGFVQPARGHGRETLFSFRDVVMLRTAHSLRKAGISPARSCGRWKTCAPHGRPTRT